MTRERDRIQENANKYIVKNCPAYQKELYTFDADTGIPITTDTNYCINPFIKNCKDCTDCVIKQVIEKSKGAISNYCNLEILRTACETSEVYGNANMAEQILQLFDIEEINK